MAMNINLIIVDLTSFWFFINIWNAFFPCYDLFAADFGSFLYLDVVITFSHLKRKCRSNRCLWKTSMKCGINVTSKKNLCGFILLKAGYNSPQNESLQIFNAHNNGKPFSHKKKNGSSSKVQQLKFSYKQINQDIFKIKSQTFQPLGFSNHKYLLNFIKSAYISGS